MAVLELRRDEWDAAYESLAFTMEALRAYGEDAALLGLAARVGVVLRDWHAIEAEGQKLRYEAVASEARVRVADALLDGELDRFAAALLKHTEGKRDHALYQKLFPAPHEEVIALGLDAEVPVVTLIAQTLDADEALPAPLRECREGLRAALQRGTGALSARPAALANLGRHAARVEAWLENAANTRQSVHRGLRVVAHDRKFPGRWAQSFFR
jgi:hypothetical protein